MNTRGIFFTILSAVLFGITPIITTAIYTYGANANTVVFFRSLLVIPILYLIMKFQHVSLKISKKDIVNVAIIAIFGSGLTTILLFTSYAYLDVGTATTLHFLYPIVVSLLCFFIYKERLGKVKLFALCFAFLGMLYFMDFKQSAQLTGILFAVGSAITYAFYMVQMEKTKLTHHNAYQISFYIAIFITLETLVSHFIQPSINLVLPLQAYGLFLLLAIISSFLAVVFLQLGIKQLGSSTASLFCLFEPITSIIAGFFFLHETITLSKLIGCLMIVSSLLILSYGERKNRIRHQQNK